MSRTSKSEMEENRLKSLQRNPDVAVRVKKDYTQLPIQGKPSFPRRIFRLKRKSFASIIKPQKANADTLISDV